MKRHTAGFALSLLLVTACGDDPWDVEEGSDPPWEIEVDESEFVAAVTNTFTPMKPGARWVYHGESDGEHEMITVEVLAEKKTVWGVSATVVRDTVTVDGELEEDTLDWFAQDEDENVWYLGEDTCEYDDGECVSHAGAWEAGVDGAIPGILMPGSPNVGDRYYQEYYAGIAEDFGEVVAVDTTVQVPAGNFKRCVRTRDTSRLDPSIEEFKTYCPGIGLVLEEEGDTRVELVEVSGTR